MTVPVFQYTASDIGGKIKKGQLTTANSGQLKEMLRNQNLYLIKYEEKINTSSCKKLKANQISEFCRELSSLLGSGVSVVRSFNIISQRNMEPGLKAAYTDISTQIKRGIALSDAMAMQGKMFPEMLINMIKAGEASGKINQTFEKMSVHYEKEYRMANSVRSAMTYPIVLLVLIVCVMMVLFTFVLPTFFGLFEGMELPLLTRIVMKLSKTIKENLFLIILIAIFLSAAICFIVRLHPVRYRIDKFKVHMPKIGKLMKIIYTAQFARTLSSLYSSGMNIMDSLQISRNTIPNVYIREQFESVIKSVRSGNTLSEALSSIDGFDIKLSQTVEIGEETGRLDAMLNSTADSYEYESQTAINKMITILQPLMIIIMAGLVLVVIGAVMIPIFSMYGNIENSGVNDYDVTADISQLLINTVRRCV